jgi:hypothetical protein
MTSAEWVSSIMCVLTAPVLLSISRQVHLLAMSFGESAVFGSPQGCPIIKWTLLMALVIRTPQLDS